MTRTTHRWPAAAIVVLSCLIAGLAAPPPVAADALYPGDSAGTWAFGEVCEDAPWTGDWTLWYIINDAIDYEFDDPDPDLVPGQTITVDLAPAVIGPGLRGRLTMTGATSVTGTIPATQPQPDDSVWQGILDDAEFGLSWEPDPAFMSVGIDATLPDGWADAYIGVLGFEATITADGVATETIMLAQPITDCSASASPSPAASASPSPTPSDAAKPSPSAAPTAVAPSPSAAVTAPPTDAMADAGGRGAAPWFTTILVMLLLAAGSLPAAVAMRRRA